MSKIPKILDLEKCEWQKAREKVFMKCFQGDNITLQFAKIEPGHTIAPHSHNYEQIALILEGECDFFVDGIAYNLKAGSVMGIPPLVEHYIQVKGSISVVNIDIFFPKRNDRKESVMKD